MLTQSAALACVDFGERTRPGRSMRYADTMAPAATSARERHGRVLRRVTNLTRAGRNEEALSILFALRERHPRDPELLGRLGGLLSWAGRRQDAAEVMLQQARLYLDEGANLRALASCDMALRFGSGHLEETHTLKGWTLADLGCLHEAWQSLEAAYRAAVAVAHHPGAHIHITLSPSPQFEAALKAGGKIVSSEDRQAPKPDPQGE